ncbi:MAG: hypothetical protein Q4F95_02335 [Oscillospiraceae bacterium]|nr:hypothetical protein [Oscillospiraceae bacterium]
MIKQDFTSCEMFKKRPNEPCEPEMCEKYRKKQDKYSICGCDCCINFRIIEGEPTCAIESIDKLTFKDMISTALNN